jgi:hypothetical protein
VAASVAQKCILSLCVGHREELQELCEQGLDAAIEKLHEELASMRFDAVTLSSGTASMWDAAEGGGARDGALDRIAGGVWTASLDLGMGPRPAPATFSGVRH